MLDKYLLFLYNQPLACLAVFITFLPIVLFLIKKAYSEKALRLLFIYLIIKLLIDISMFHLASNTVNNLMLYNINIPLRYLLLSGMFYYYFESKRAKKWILTSSTLFLIIVCWDILQANPSLTDMRNHSLVYYSDTLESLLMILWILLYFYEMLYSLKAANLLTFTFFWVSSGLLLFYSSLVFITPVLHYANQWENRLQLGFLEKMPYLFETISMICISIGIWFFKHPAHDQP
jgi:hypothetical protein